MGGERLKLLTKRRALLIATAVLIAVSTSSLIVYALAPAIWGASSGPLNVTDEIILPTSLSAVTWNGSMNIKSTDTLLLEVTISPTPTHQQSVDFFITLVVNPTPSTPIIGIAGDYETGMYKIGTALSVGSTAKLTIGPLPAGAYYFIPRIATPS
jgi:hypothetical protein